MRSKRRKIKKQKRQSSATMFLRNDEKYIYLIDNLLLFLIMIEFSKSVNS